MYTSKPTFPSLFLKDFSGSSSGTVNCSQQEVTKNRYIV